MFADQRLVGEFWLDNKTEPTTITVPIFKCRQLMFWLECGDQRSGQFVFYDLKVSKDPCTIPIPEHYSTNISTDSGKSSKESVKSEKKVVSEEEKQKRREKAAKAVNVGLDIIQSLLK